MSALCLPAYGSEFYKLTEKERTRVIDIAISESDSRIPVIAQANHPSAYVASGLARQYESMGAHMISFAIPRQFGSSASDIFDYCSRIADAVECPILIQDFNPGGVTIDADFIAGLLQRHSNFKYVKFEEPLLMDKLVRILERVGDRVGVFGGWGGCYMLELVPLGLCGIMPGVSICDILDRVFQSLRQSESERAYGLFGEVLPYMFFSLQDFEMFLQIEKRLMVRRGIFDSHCCRSLTRTLSPEVLEHIDFLLDNILRILEEESLTAL
jgi:4-hydroxy-tetrahydrodipicolinate synthase